MFEYKSKGEKQLKADYYRRNKAGLNGFSSFEEFKKWYDNQEKKCHFCSMKEEEIQEIVMTGLLKSKRFPQNGVVGQGKARGVFLEVDKLNPKKKYSPENSVLCCYFCNNDKSDVFYGEDYRDFFQNRTSFLKNLLKKK
nr:hypothetical protein [Muricauda sp. UBA7809]